MLSQVLLDTSNSFLGSGLRRINSMGNRRQGLARIASGLDLDLPLSSKASSVSKGSQPARDDFVYNGNLAVDCLPFDTTQLDVEEVKKVITDQHLLQFGSIIGESSADLAIGLQGYAAALGPSGDSLYGAVDCPAQHAKVGSIWWAAQQLRARHCPSI